MHVQTGNWTCFVRNQRVFRYTVNLTRERIVSEILEEQCTPPDGTAFDLIYRRQQDVLHKEVSIEFGKKHKLNQSETEKLYTELLPNNTALATLNRKMTISSERIREAYKWFSRDLMGEITPKLNLIRWASLRLEDGRIDKNQIIASMSYENDLHSHLAAELGYLLKTIFSDNKKFRVYNSNRPVFVEDYRGLGTGVFNADGMVISLPSVQFFFVSDLMYFKFINPYFIDFQIRPLLYINPHRPRTIAKIIT